MIVSLDNILIYIKDAGQAYVNFVQWVFKQLRKHGFFATLKKCCFYQNKVCFLKYIISVKRVQMEEEKIEEVKKWPGSKLIPDI